MSGYLRRHAWEAVGLVLTLLCLWLALRNARLDEVLAVLARAQWTIVLAAVVLNAAVYGATAARWQQLFRPHVAPPLRHLLAGLLLAQLANTLLPAKLGPAVRAVYVGQVQGVSKLFVLATVVGEKVWEGLTLLLAFALVAGLAPVPAWLVGPAWLAGGASLALFVAIWLAAGNRQRAMQLLRAAVRRFPWLRQPTLSRWSGSLLDSLETWRLAGSGRRIAGWSAIIWGLTAAINYLVLQALGIRAPAVAALLLLVVLQAGTRVPSAPASVGIFHYLTVATLGAFGVAPGAALSYAVVLHGLIFLVPAAAGALVLTGLPRSFAVSLRGIRRRELDDGAGLSEA